jgi:hypothetical protein
MEKHHKGQVHTKHNKKRVCHRIFKHTPDIKFPTYLTSSRDKSGGHVDRNSKTGREGGSGRCPHSTAGKRFLLKPFLSNKKIGRFSTSSQFKETRPTRDRSSLSNGNVQIGTIRPHEWVASLDLSDAYFHVPVNAGSRQYLRFQFAGKHYQFKVLVFGLKSAPRVFTKVVATVMSHLRTRGVRIHAYLDWLLRA